MLTARRVIYVLVAVLGVLAVVHAQHYRYYQRSAHFLLTGWNVDVCNGGPYNTQRHPSNNGVPSCMEPAYTPGS